MSSEIEKKIKVEAGEVPESEPEKQAREFHAEILDGFESFELSLSYLMRLLMLYKDYYRNSAEMKLYAERLDAQNTRLAILSNSLKSPVQLGDIA